MKKTFTLIFTLLTTILIAQNSNFEKFEKEYKNGNLDKAVTYLKKSIKNNEKHRVILYAWLGDVLAKQKKFKASADNYVKMLSHAEGSSEKDLGLVYFSIGSNYYFGQEYKKAIEYLEKALASGHKDSGIANNLAWSYSQIKQHKKAIQYFEMAYKEDPKYINNINNLGYAYYLNNELEKAEEYILKAKEIDENNSFVYRNLGLIALKRGNKTKACTLLQKAIDKGIVEKWGELYIRELNAYCK